MFFKDIYIYFREKAQKQGRGTEGERENPQADSLLSTGPNEGLGLRTLRP